MRILISAGEASGEMYGAQLIQAMRECVDGGAQNSEPQECSQPNLEFFGVGGEKMRAAGCDIVVDAKDLSVVGISEILSHLPKIWGLFHKLIAEADTRRPDLAIVIDSPAFNWRVARQMKKRGVPVVYYVCPQFWAWRQGRVRLLRKYIDEALVIFPFEEKFYCDRGVRAEFVGHPLADISRPTISREEYATRNGLVASKPWITLMPGSRNKEVRMNLPEMAESARLLGRDYEFLLPVAPTLDPGLIEPLARTARIQLVPEALPALAHSRAGIIASGTATVEAALMGTPFVMVYRVTPLTYLLGRWTVKVPHFAMVNLIAEARIVPELVQKDFTAGKIVEELRKILADSQARRDMLSGLEKIRVSLGSGVSSSQSAAQRAAMAALKLVAVRN